MGHVERPIIIFLDKFNLLFLFEHKTNRSNDQRGCWKFIKKRSKAQNEDVGKFYKLLCVETDKKTNLVALKVLLNLHLWLFEFLFNPSVTSIPFSSPYFDQPGVCGNFSCNSWINRMKKGSSNWSDIKNSFRSMFFIRSVI